MTRVSICCLAASQKVTPQKLISTGKTRCSRSGNDDIASQNNGPSPLSPSARRLMPIAVDKLLLVNNLSFRPIPFLIANLIHTDLRLQGSLFSRLSEGGFHGWVLPSEALNRETIELLIRLLKIAL